MKPSDKLKAKRKAIDLQIQELKAIDKKLAEKARIYKLIAKKWKDQ